NDLRSTPFLRMKSGDGIEKKIEDLGEKELKADELKKQSEELVLMAYKVAAVAQSAVDWAEKIEVQGGDKTQKNWLQWSQEMRKHALELATAAKGGKPAAVYAAAGKLDATCTRCHKVFK